MSTRATAIAIAAAISAIGTACTLTTDTDGLVCHGAGCLRPETSGGTTGKEATTSSTTLPSEPAEAGAPARSGSSGGGSVSDSGAACACPTGTVCDNGACRVTPGTSTCANAIVVPKSGATFVGTICDNSHSDDVDYPCDESIFGQPSIFFAASASPTGFSATVTGDAPSVVQTTTDATYCDTKSGSICKQQSVGTNAAVLVGSGQRLALAHDGDACTAFSITFVPR